MFTGIVQKTGKIKKIEGDTFTITSDLNLENLDIGGSIALNGACLTIISLEKNSFSIQVTPETLKRTNLKYLKTQDIVNLNTFKNEFWTRRSHGSRSHRWYCGDH